MRCPPPTGMIADAGALSMDEVARLAHASEEECLAFVAMSRARHHLRLYLSRTQPNGNGRKPSSFLLKIDGLYWDHTSPVIMAAGSDRAGFVDVVLPAEYAVTDSRIGSYLNCPRRYFYTHVLGLGGSKRPTAFTTTHQCIYELIGWLHIEQAKRIPTPAEVEARFEEIWIASEMPGKPGAAEYKALAARIMASLLKSGENRSFREGRPIAIDLAAGRIIIEPHAIARLADGTMVLRHVRMGGYRLRVIFEAPRDPLAQAALLTCVTLASRVFLGGVLFSILRRIHACFALYGGVLEHFVISDPSAA